MHFIFDCSRFQRMLSKNLETLHMRGSWSWIWILCNGKQRNNNFNTLVMTVIHHFHKMRFQEFWSLEQRRDQVIYPPTSLCRRKILFQCFINLLSDISVWHSLPNRVPERVSAFSSSVDDDRRVILLQLGQKALLLLVHKALLQLHSATSNNYGSKM